MLLEIPLFNSNTDLSLNMSCHEELMKEIRDDPDLYSIFNNFTTSGEEIREEIIDMSGEEIREEIIDMSGVQNPEVTDQHTGESFPDIPEQVYEDLVRELTQDPQLKAIFDDIEIHDDTEDPELKAIFDDINHEEQTPLEIELNELGW